MKVEVEAEDLRVALNDWSGLYQNEGYDIKDDAVFPVYERLFRLVFAGDPA